MILIRVGQALKLASWLVSVLDKAAFPAISPALGILPEIGHRELDGSTFEITLRRRASD
jgi:hypothetical protein